MSLAAQDPSNPAHDPPAERAGIDARLALVLAAQLAFGVGWSAYLILPKYLTTVLGASPATVGRISATSGFSAVATICLVLLLIDRVRRARLLQAGSLLVVAASLAYPHVQTLGLPVYLLQSCIGAAFVLAFNASVTLMTESAPPERLGQTIGWLGAVNMTTNAIGSATAERVAATHGWNIVFYACAVTGALAFALSFFIPEARARRQSRAAREGDATAAVPPDAAPVSSPATRGTEGELRPKALAIVLACSALAGVTFTAMFTFLQPFALGHGAGEVAPFFLGFTTAAVVVRLGFGSLGDRHGRRRVARLALLVYGGSAVAAAWLAVPMLWVYGAAFGLAHGIFYPTLNAYALEFAPASYRGRVVTLFNGVFNVGSASGALLWGSLAERAGYPPVFLIAGALPMLAALLLGMRSAEAASKPG